MEILKTECTGSTYKQNSTFSTNLNSLLSALKDNSLSSMSINQTSGEAPATVFGLYFCTGDLSHGDCQFCIQRAIEDINGSCSNYKQAIIWYEYCQLRYSDTNFFGVPDTNGFSMVNYKEITTSSKPVEVVSQLVREAPLAQPLMFKSLALEIESLYALAQCSSDLTTKECSNCLTTILANIKACCSSAKGWRFLAPSCWIRYEATPFLRNLNGTRTYITKSYCSSDDFPASNGLNATAQLESLLSSLTEQAPSFNGFYNTSEGEDMNKIYGLALCRGDLQNKTDDCQSCLQDASKSIVEDCPNKTQAIEWYEKCFIKYSNQNFFGKVDTDSVQWLCSVNYLSAEASNATVNLALGLINDTVNNQMFVGAEEEEISNSLKAYFLLQCTRDLSKDGCRRCLQTGMSQVSNECNQTNGWRYLSSSCTLRFEVGPFFDTALISNLSSPVSPKLNNGGEGKKKLNSVSIAVIAAPVLGFILLGSCILYIWWRLRHRNGRRRKQFDEYRPLTSNDLPFMDLATIQAATGGFAVENKLGEGGFGPVYKGVLNNGTEIAVKRLSPKSKQGAIEFENEVKLIAKLQHRNLVRMLGWCAEREEKLLIYEYLPNKGLDALLFDSEKRAQLDWNRRLKIIGGIAKGLLYLHEDSLLKVIHRDLKASNVLLDNKMTPKISDFGMAKIFGGEENEANTNRVVGTYGYMAPEYAMGGLFSVKSDVFSFGVLLIEVLTGQRNGKEHFGEYGQTLIRNMWHLWIQDKALELMDPLLGHSYPVNEAKKYIKIGLLCVQENTEERPTMSIVVHMFRSSDETVFPAPSQPPTFMKHRDGSPFFNDNMVDGSSSSINSQSLGLHSINGITMSEIEAR
ncbi:cysteine-rich receptor-like protein kinase 5 [Dioscorea cayenensis subsp. rotundata]|uniref:non-specific serine/threonine protein kinase n=1 Tax=Dioscorea cayennensis subsp. rotundata TaxID=55577 RepID=A0AB40BNJ0_DIOCR|nr:cysteine-rich receptor-like protein kinase 5 [Dioscorea cayenensis subsp. rotundata]